MAVETITEANPELSEYNLDDYDEDKPQAQGIVHFFFAILSIQFQRASVHFERNVCS
jgi:hypothetical protein